MPSKSKEIHPHSNISSLLTFELFIYVHRIIVMGTNEKIGVNIHVDQLMDTIASNLPLLERLELRYVMNL